MVSPLGVSEMPPEPLNPDTPLPQAEAVHTPLHAPPAPLPPCPAPLLNRPPPSPTAAPQAEADPYALERPSWMEGNPKTFSEEQIKEAKEFAVREIEAGGNRVRGLG